MTLPHTLFASLLLLVVEWRDDGDLPDSDDRAEHLEACRECMRSLVTVLGVHRHTEIFAECWVLLTEAMCSSMDDLQHVQPSRLTIAGAAPGERCASLRDLGRVRHADIFEEEISGSLVCVDSMRELGGQSSPEVDQWLQDLRFMLGAAQLAMHVRST